MLPESIRTKIDVLLWSEVEGCVPRGRYQEFFLGLINDYFEKLKASQEQEESQDVLP
jgi:hypothetical protein